MQTLNGIWKLATDPHSTGRTENRFDAIRTEAQPVPVQCVIQQVFPGYHGVAWYWHTFELAEAGTPEERVLLRFGAVGYLAEVWLNGQLAGSYEAGETPFELDVSELAHTKAIGGN
jgi:beta-galactosidase/beta-glucuronidase